MNKIYLVCTRSAITASALTYIINSSPDFYNLSHNNLWLTEDSEWFGTAHIINDWWNVSDRLKAGGYDADFRNSERLSYSQLTRLVDAWQDINTGKNICLFTHARNVKEIMDWRDEHQLPVTVITTRMGANCTQFIGGVLRREFNPEMNQYENLISGWDHIYNQLTVQDAFWSQHNDISFEMHDWLKDTRTVYNKLGITENTNIKLWCDQYLLFNDMSEEFETENGVLYETQREAYKIQLFTYLVLHYSLGLDEKSRNSYARALPQVYLEEKRIFDLPDFAAAAMSRAGIPVDIINKIAYNH